MAPEAGRGVRGGATGAGNRGSPEPLFHTRRFHADGTATGESTDNHYTAHYVHTPCSSQSGVCLHLGSYMNPLYSSSFMASWALGNRNACSRKPSDVHRSVESLTEFGVRRTDDVAHSTNRIAWKCQMMHSALRGRLDLSTTHVRTVHCIND